MMGKKKLSEIRRELNDLFAKLPGGADVWFEREIRTATGQPERDVQTLKMLRAATQKPARKRRPRRAKQSLHLSKVVR